MVAADTYTALEECARRRIGAEWECSDAERAVLLLINELSHALGQSWALVPTVSQLAQALGIHRSTAGRAIRSAVAKGYLQILHRRDETLYSICTETPGAPVQDAARQAARERLLELNRNREQGRADGNGQQRLPGIFPSEEVAAPAAAFGAMLEQESMAAVPHGTPSAPRPSTTVSPSTPGGHAQRIEAALQRIAQNPASDTAPRRAAGKYDAKWADMTRGLTDQESYCLAFIRDECRAKGSKGEAEFYQWGTKWRQRAKSQTGHYIEAAGVCKAMRLEGKGPDSPGAFMYRTVEAMLKIGADDG